MCDSDAKRDRKHDPPERPAGYAAETASAEDATRPDTGASHVMSVPREACALFARAVMFVCRAVRRYGAPAAVWLGVAVKRAAVDAGEQAKPAFMRWQNDWR